MSFIRKAARPVAIGAAGVGVMAAGIGWAAPLVSAEVKGLATAEDTSTDLTTATDTATVNVVNGGLSLKKTSNKSTVLAGQKVTYSYAVTATGVPFSEIQVEDDKCSPVTYVSGDTNSDKVLQPGETWQYTCAQVLTTTTTNIGKVQGKPILSGGGGGGTPTPTPSPTATGTPTLKDGTYLGPATSVNIPGVSGDVFNVQVQVVISGGQIQTVTVPVMSAKDKTSVFLSNDAIPTLVTETIAAQNSNIAAVSGATYTSTGFKTSLQGALALAAA